MKKTKTNMKSIQRGERLTILLIVLFLLGMVVLVIKVTTQASFYMAHSDNINLGCVYDRDGEVLFDPEASAVKYPYDYFVDVGNLIGDDTGRMTNTLVSENLDKLQNYNMAFGAMENGQSAIYTTLDHDANRAVYDAFGSKNGTAIAYNYKTGEILICVSKPSVNILDYGDINALESGSLLCKAFYATVPGSTQKVSTLIAALESIGYDALIQKSYPCSGVYINNNGSKIDCHNLAGHGMEDVQMAFQNSCNPWFAQLVEELPLDDIINTYKKMGYRVNYSQRRVLDIDGMSAFTASTELTDRNSFDTQWSCMGQSMTEVSPIQLMMWESAIANGTGRVTVPYLISYRKDMFGVVKDWANPEFEDEMFSPKVAGQVRQIMRNNGDTHYASIGHAVGVKSGTAQVNEGRTENSLLVGFTEDSNLPVAFCVVIENRIAGEVSTSQIVKTMLDALAAS